MPDWERILGQLAAVSAAPIPFLVALLIVAVLIWWAFNWRYSTVVGHRDAEVSRLKVERDEYKTKLSVATPDQAKAKIDTLVDAARGAATAERSINDTRIYWDQGGRVSLRGRFTRADGPVSIYVTYGSAGGSPAFPEIKIRSVVGGKLLVESRIKIGSIAHFDKEEIADITIGTINDVEGNQQVIQWGEPEQKNVKVGLTWTNYFCFLILVCRDGREEFYPFAFACRSHSSPDGNSTVPEMPAIFGPDVMLAHWSMQTPKN
jgi:hypothetical protein